MLGHIATLDAISCIDRNFQRKAFFINGLYWVFYSNGTNLVYRTSINGTIWSSAVTVRECDNGRKFSIWFDNVYVHYTYVSSGLSVSVIYYRRGTPNADGSVTWSTEQIAKGAVVSYEYYAPTVAVNSSRYPFISYTYRWTDTSVYKPAITKSSTNDGTWTTAADFPQDLSSTPTDWGTLVIPLTATKMYVLYLSYLSKVLYGKLWGGSGFGAQETITTGVETTFPPWPPGAFSAVNEGDHVHVVCLKFTSHNLAHKKRTYGTGWGSEVTVQSATTISTVPVLCYDPTIGTVFCFWLQVSNHQLRLKKYIAGTWSPTPNVIIEGQGIQSVVAEDDVVEEIYGTHYKSQSFISLRDDFITKLDLYIGWYYCLDLALTVSIYAADAQGRPTGTALATATITGTEEDMGCSWQRVIFTAPPEVTLNSKYCIVLSAPDAIADYPFRWAVDASSPSYIYGNWSDSIDSGVNWTADNTKDALFIVHFATEMNNAHTLSCFYNTYESIGVVWLSEDESPYSLLFSKTIAIRERFASIEMGIIEQNRRNGNHFRAIPATVHPASYAHRGLIVSRFAAAVKSIATSVAGTFIGFINTWEATDITQTTAKLHGYSNRPHTGHGFSWGKNSNEYTGRWCENGAYGAVEFEHTITNLSPNTTYYFRAKARKS